jgi:hypothetical protein
MPNPFALVPQIDQSLQGLRVHESTTRPDGAVLLRVELGRIDGNVAVSVPELWLSTSGPVGVEAMMKVMVRALRALEHDSSEIVAGLALALYAVNSAREDRCAQGLEVFLQRIVDATAEVHFVIPALQGITADFSIGSFQYERTNLHRLKDLCERVGCDYARLYGPRLEGTQTIRSAPVPCRILSKAMVVDAGPLSYRVYDDYMSAIAQRVQAAVARAYTAETALVAICSEWLFPLERLLRIAPLPGITIFRDREHKNSRGWVVPTQASVSIVQSTDFWPAGEETARHWNSSASGQLSARDDLPTWLQGPSRLVVVAMSHCGGADCDLAGLMATTAVELVLCESNQDLQRKVCELGGCICRYSTLPVRHLDENRIKQLYTARSKFVHEGMPVSERDASDLVLLSRAVVKAAAQAAGVAEQPRMLDRGLWLRKLAAIQTNEAAGIPVNVALLNAVGLND